MKRIRLSTLILLIVIAALTTALVMERNRSAALERQILRYTVYKAGGVTTITERTSADGTTGVVEGGEKQ